MQAPSASPPADSFAALRYVCEGCSTPLVLPGAQSPVSGPCPKCNLWIDASKFRMANAPQAASGANDPPPQTLRKRRSDNVIAGRGRVRADGYLDHEFNERREMFGTLRVLAVSLAVAAVILLITLYLRHWMTS